MTNLATYTQIAHRVKSWANEIKDVAGDGFGTPLADTLAEMDAFSNGLLAAVDTFAPIVAELNKIVADDNVVEHNNRFGGEFGNGDVRCPNDGEPTNVRCWKCGWVR